MATKKKLLQAAAGAAGGAALNVEEVFSTYLYDGTGSAQTITNNIDLSGEGGLVWIKNREQTDDHYLGDSERGFYRRLESNNTDAQVGNANGTWSFNSNGFTIPNFTQVNTNGENYVSWTFRKAPKFFDVVTYTGDGTSSQQITHNLGVTPGLIIVKAASSVGSNANWLVWHRSLTQSAGYLNSTNAFGGGEYTYNFNQPSDTYIDVKKVGSFASGTNDSGITYVAYLFAHNDGDGEFGPTGDQDIIKCGTFTTNGSGNATVNLGFEPQWIMVKRTNSSSNGDWIMSDSMRGWTDSSTGRERFLAANLNTREGQDSGDGVYSNSVAWKPTSTGFEIYDGYPFEASSPYIYIAIRRGPMAVPTDATDVFGIDSNTGQTGMQTGVLNDMGIAGSISSTDKWYIGSRLTQGLYLQTNTTAAEPSSGASPIWNFDSMDSFFNGTTWNGYIGYGWKRAPNFFDVVAYTGTGSTMTINHNLGVTPEMIWVKRRDSSTGSWWVYHKALNVDNDNAPETDYITLHQNFTAADFPIWNDTAPTATQFSLGNYTNTTGSGGTFIAYLFASLDGVSKVGSFTHSGGNTNVDCGFSSGARFVLIKKSSDTSGWFVWDSERGIVAGNDPYLLLNSTAAEFSVDTIDPYSSGFTITDVQGSGTYIFYAIA